MEGRLGEVGGGGLQPGFLLHYSGLNMHLNTCYRSSPVQMFMDFTLICLNLSWKRFLNCGGHRHDLRLAELKKGNSYF